MRTNDRILSLPSFSKCDLLQIDRALRRGATELQMVTVDRTPHAACTRNVVLASSTKTLRFVAYLSSRPDRRAWSNKSVRLRSRAKITSPYVVIGLTIEALKRIRRRSLFSIFRLEIR